MTHVALAFPVLADGSVIVIAAAVFTHQHSSMVTLVSCYHISMVTLVSRPHSSMVTPALHAHTAACHTLPHSAGHYTSNQHAVCSQQYQAPDCLYGHTSCSIPTYPEIVCVVLSFCRFLVPAVGVGFAISWFAYYVNRKLYSTTPKSLTPEFQAEARRIGPVAERVAGPPVFLDPIRHRIPGYIRGPEDLKEA